MRAEKTKKKSALLIVLVLVLVLAAIAGTIAWLTDTDTVTNTFTIGAMDEPTVGPTPTPNPDPDPDDPTDPPNTYDPKEDGYIFEPWYEDLQEIAPGGDYAKDPYVGVGAGSEAAYIFVEVENNFGEITVEADNPKAHKAVYFVLNDGWDVVEATPIVIDGDTYYADGIFTYDTIIGGGNSDVWTATPVFSTVIVSDNATYDSLAGAEYNPDEASTPSEAAKTTMVINAFIHQAKDGNGDAIVKSVATAAAKTYFAAPVTP